MNFFYLFSNGEEAPFFFYSYKFVNGIYSMIVSEAAVKGKILIDMNQFTLLYHSLAVVILL